ncbi:MAG: hypothetical protein IJ838_02065 [Paludibacteraceae bacterium]|nr:hypothetical protein [Paludibacteraceae bacterium]
MKNLNLISFLIVLCLVACTKKQIPTLPRDDEYAYNEEEIPSNPADEDVAPSPSEYEKETNSPRQNLPQQVYDIWSYSPQEVNVPSHSPFGQVVYDTYPNFRKVDEYDYIGGAKLIGEMAADRAGYNYSYYSYPIVLQIPSLSGLHLGLISSSKNVICQVLSGHIRVKSSRIITGYGGMKIEIRLVNKTGSYQDAVFEQGQMVEVTEPHVQNVVISSGSAAQLAPNDSWSFTLPVFCAAHHRDSPVGFSAKLTPYVMNAPSTTFQSQQRIWDVLESNDDPNSYVTFYVWGKGDIASRSGRRSTTGHAFVRIPHIGVIGFSSLHGGLLDDDGHISDHASSVRYATDSCRIKVSEEAQKAMIKKLRQLQGNVPKYRIGRYDCTSFVMDIADAAGIRYGARITIQTPVGFMQELKKHNYSY